MEAENRMHHHHDQHSLLIIQTTTASMKSIINTCCSMHAAQLESALYHGKDHWPALSISSTDCDVQSFLLPDLEV